jgi:SAM-dependent methyltransferase
VPQDCLELQEKLARYNFYHCIALTPEVTTKGYEDFVPLQAPVQRALETLPVQGQRVLDIGCRDGLFSLQAERQGAAEVIGIDNDLSRGAVDVILPHFRSKVKMYEVNIYDLTPEMFGQFGFAIFPGVLYHLRYPMWALKRVRDVLLPQGWLLIETALFLKCPELPLLYCPIDEESPYEPTSVSFFNIKGLTDTLSSLGIRVESVHLLGAEVKDVDRATLICRFVPEMVHSTQKLYWEQSHRVHSDYSPEEGYRLVREKSEVLYRKAPR